MGPKTLVIASCLVSLLTGVCLGVAADRTCLDRPPHRWQKGGKMHEGEIARMTDAVKLDQDQRDKVRAIFEARKPQMDEIFKDMRPKMEAVRRDSENAIRAILTPEQLPRFEDYLKEREQREREMRDRMRAGKREDRQGGSPGTGSSGAQPQDSK